MKLISKAAACLAALTVLHASFIAFLFASQPPLDNHAFRQSQTALTAYWFKEEGFKFAYETPVAGYPWSIPFEFPLYQWIVASVSHVFGTSLDATGRITSFLFLLTCLVPIHALSKKLKLNRDMFYAFTAILFSSSTYLYWGRAFMIETAALFFSICAIKYFVDAQIDGLAWKNATLLSVFMTLALLQKSTTGLPVLAIMGLILTGQEIIKWKSSDHSNLPKFFLWSFIAFVIPFLICFIWTRYTDSVKLLNPFGTELTSSSLQSWNFGTLKQRLSSAVFVKVFWKRITLSNLGNIAGLFLLTLPFLIRTEKRIKNIFLASLAFGLAPIFIFTNLHVVHSYYQTAITLFLIFAIAIALIAVFVPRFGETKAGCLLFFIVASNLIFFYRDYFSDASEQFSKKNQDFAVGAVLRRDILVGGQFVVTGNEWSSTLGYMSQRKSFTASEMFKDYDSVLKKPETFVEKGKLGAVVACDATQQQAQDLLNFASTRSWKLGQVDHCLISTPQAPPPTDTAAQIQCRGEIDHATIEELGGKSVISIKGWIAEHANSAVFISLTDQNQNEQTFEALKVPRLEINKQQRITPDEDVGFSFLHEATLPAGSYTVSLILGSKDNRGARCHLKRELSID